MAKALVVYATRSGETGDIANLIAEGIRFTGAEATVVDVTTVKKEEDLAGFDAYVFGSATYHGDMMQAMKTMLFLAETVGLEGKAGGAFGAFGWSGEACKQLTAYLEEMGVEIVAEPVRSKYVADDELLAKCHEMGVLVGKKLLENK